MLDCAPDSAKWNKPMLANNKYNIKWYKDDVDLEAPHYSNDDNVKK
jgi:hypothetical protein